MKKRERTVYIQRLDELKKQSDSNSLPCDLLRRDLRGREEIPVAEFKRGAESCRIIPEYESSGYGKGKDDLHRIKHRRPGPPEKLSLPYFFPEDRERKQHRRSALRAAADEKGEKDGAGENISAEPEIKAPYEQHEPLRCGHGIRDRKGIKKQNPGGHDEGERRKNMDEGTVLRRKIFLQELLRKGKCAADKKKRDKQHGQKRRQHMPGHKPKRQKKQYFRGNSEIDIIVSVIIRRIHRI